MRTIKIKVKHMIIILAAFMFIISFGEPLFWKSVKAYNKVVPDNYKFETAAMSGKTIKSENERLKTILSDHDYRLYNLLNLSDGATMSGAYIRRESSEKVMRQFQEFGGKKLYESNPEYALNVALMQWFSGDVDKTIGILEAMNPKSMDSDDYNHYQMIRLGVALTLYDIEAVIEILDLIDDEGFEIIENQIKMFLAINFDIAVDYEEESMHFDDTQSDIYYGFFDQIIQINRQTLHEFSKGNLIEKKQSLSGKVLINGQPFKGAFIYEDINRGMSTLDGFDYRNFTVDDNGEFYIDKIDQRTLALGVMVPWQLVHNKQYNSDWDVDEDTNEIIFAFDDCVKFTSLKVDGNELHYKIEDVLASEDRSYYLKIQYVNPKYDVNGSFISLIEPLTDLKGTLNIDEIKRGAYSTYLNVSGDVTFERLVEPLYYTDDYYFRLSVSDDSTDGYISNGIISDSSGYVLTVDGLDKIVEGDQLIKEGKTEEAIKWYEDNLDMHSLKVLVALYSRGYIPVEDVDFQPWIIGGVDKEKAAMYLEQLIEEYGSRENDLLRLYNLYTDLMDHQRAMRPLQLLNKDDNDYYKFLLGENKINQGLFTEGIEELIAIKDLDYDRYIHYLFVSNRVEALPTEFYELFEDIDTSRFLEFFDYILDNQYDQGWQWLEMQEDSDLKRFFQLMMLESFETELIDYGPLIEGRSNEYGGSYNFIDYFVDETNNILDNNLRSILMLLREDNNWFSR